MSSRPLLVALAILSALPGLAQVDRAVVVGTVKDATRIGVLYDPGLHLFADTVEIERMWDVSRVLGKPENSAEPILFADRPWEAERVIFNFCSSVIFDAAVGKFRMWYAAIVNGHATPDLPELMCYAESDDGVRWVKPALGIVEYRGSRDNNIVYSSAGTGLIPLHQRPP